MRDLDVDEARNDYGRFLAEYGFTAEQVWEIASSESDRVPMPDGFDKVKMQPSEIAGQGMFVVSAARAGELLAPARLDGKRTPGGWGVNHARSPNAQFVKGAGNDLNIVALRPLAPGEEVTIDYRQAARVNGSTLEPNLDEVIETVRLRRLAQRLGRRGA